MIPTPFVVLQGVAGDGMSNTIDEPPELDSVDDHPLQGTSSWEWNETCRARELQRQADWLEQCGRKPRRACCWTTSDGCLALMNCLPTKQLMHCCSALEDRKAPPGTLVQAVEILTMDSKTMEPILEVGKHDFSQFMGRPGWIQFLKLTTGKFIILSYEGYCNAVPQSIFAPGIWLWRVTCAAGAVVRSGLDLSSTHVCTIPYGALVRVTQKTINCMALSRLRIEAECDGIDICGWCSEFLNPLSGQRGAILLPLPFCSPCVYRVSKSIPIRASIESSSPVIGHADRNALLTVTGRLFSEQPKESCFQSLRLAGSGGWIACNDPATVQYVSRDESFDANMPYQYHVQALRKVRSQQVIPAPKRSRSPTISPINSDDDDETVTEPACTYTTATPKNRTTIPPRNIEDLCLICLWESRTACIVHGETGHIACCLVCARILEAQGEPCPVCRAPIDLVIQHFWS